MKSNGLFRSLLVLACTVCFAAAAHAGPIITVSPTTAGPLSCSDSATFTVTYDPNDYTGELWGFSIDVQNGSGGYVTFGEADIANVGWTGGFFQPVAQPGGAISVDAGVLGGSQILAGTVVDLFTVTVHGAATGTGQLNVVDITLTPNGPGSITPDPVTNPMAQITVDCTAPAAPTMNPEPVYTAGLQNTVSWTTVTDPSTPVEYLVACSNGDDSGWIAATSYTFTGLVHGDTYTYQVKARDGVGNESALSAGVSSTQDDVTPESSVGSMPAAIASWSFPVPWTGSDDLSGLQYVQLQYRVDGGPWMGFGTTFTSSPIAFIATMDGTYEFYTIATDNAGNAEANPEADAVLVIVDTTAPAAPVMDAEPPFTQGVTNEVSWGTVVDAAEYRVYCSNGADSGWITATSYTFIGLVDTQLYTYWVQARDALNNASGNSATVQSTQDDTKPISSAATTATGNAQTFNVDVTYSDNTSGVALIRLFYNQNGTTWTQYGTGFPATGSPQAIPFTAPGDGSFDFYSIAIDAVGNVELAPVVPDFNLLIDTQGPQGTMVINGDDTYTTDANVTIDNALTDPNGVISMRFDFGAGWTAWVPYAATATGTLVGGDGTRTVLGEFQDGTGQVTQLTDTIILDTTPPGAVTQTGFVPGHEAVNLTWTDPADTDVASIEIWAALWDDVQDAVGNSTYPEFNDILWGPGFSGGGMPTVAGDLAPDADWFLLANVPAGDQTYVHTDTSPWQRGAYKYYLFARDLAGNYSLAHIQWGTSCINYILGDFNADGQITIGADVTGFAVAYGEDEGDPAYDPIYDIGPANGPWPFYHMPTTDNTIGFEDLMVLAATYNNQAKSGPAPTEATTPMLAWFQVDASTWALGLAEPASSLRGLRLSATLPDGVQATVQASDQALGGTPHVVLNDAKNGLDVGFAILEGHTVPGTGELFRVTTSEPVDLSAVRLDVRDATNTELAYELSSEPLVILPTAYALHGNFPNPFNPQTTIKFALPEGQNVRLAIFDIRGRRVLELLNEALPAGNHSVVWDGRDATGRTVASGTYFYRVQAGPLQDTRRMLLVK